MQQSHKINFNQSNQKIDMNQSNEWNGGNFESSRDYYVKVLNAIKESFGHVLSQHQQLEGLLHASLISMHNIVRTNFHEDFIDRSFLQNRLNLLSFPFEHARRSGYTLHEFPYDDERRLAFQCLLLYVIRPYICQKYSEIETFLSSFKAFEKRGTSEQQYLLFVVNWMELLTCITPVQDNMSLFIALVSRIDCSVNENKYSCTNQNIPRSDFVYIYQQLGQNVAPGPFFPPTTLNDVSECVPLIPNLLQSQPQSQSPTRRQKRPRSDSNELNTNFPVSTKSCVDALAETLSPETKPPVNRLLIEQSADSFLPNSTPLPPPSSAPAPPDKMGGRDPGVDTSISDIKLELVSSPASAVCDDRIAPVTVTKISISVPPGDESKGSAGGGGGGGGGSLASTHDVFDSSVSPGVRTHEPGRGGGGGGGGLGLLSDLAGELLKDDAREDARLGELELERAARLSGYSLPTNWPPGRLSGIGSTAVAASPSSSSSSSSHRPSHLLDVPLNLHQLPQVRGDVAMDPRNPPDSPYLKALAKQFMTAYSHGLERMERVASGAVSAAPSGLSAMVPVHPNAVPVSVRKQIPTTKLMYPIPPPPPPQFASYQSYLNTPRSSPVDIPASASAAAGGPLSLSSYPYSLPSNDWRGPRQHVPPPLDTNDRYGRPPPQQHQQQQRQQQLYQVPRPSPQLTGYPALQRLPEGGDGYGRLSGYGGGGVGGLGGGRLLTGMPPMMTYPPPPQTYPSASDVPSYFASRVKTELPAVPGGNLLGARSAGMPLYQEKHYSSIPDGLGLHGLGVGGIGGGVGGGGLVPMARPSLIAGAHHFENCHDDVTQPM